MSTITASTKHKAALYSIENLPESDGKPMAETPKHVQQIVDTLASLQERFRNDPSFVVYGNILVYYLNRTGTLKRISPDIFAVRGVPKMERRVYSVEEENKGPDVVIEFTSKGTKKEDLGRKKKIYAWLDVKEYFLFDPQSEYLDPPFIGFRLIGGEYIPLVPEGTGLRMHSEVLGLDLIVEKNALRFYDPGTGERLRTPREAEAERRAAERKTRQEAQARRAAEKKAQQEEAARQAAEVELARLQEELAQLRKE